MSDAIGERLQPLRRATGDLLWRQWRAIDGFAGEVTPARAIVDPEALALMTIALNERRLTKVMYHWVLAHSGLLSVQRVKNLIRDPGPQYNAASLALLAYSMGKDPRWRSLVQPGAILPDGGHRPRSVPPLLLRAPSAVLLRLRLGLGVGIKADALAFLLGSPGWATVPEATRATGYTVAAVRRALDELATGHFVEADEPSAWGGNRARMYRADHDAWRSVADLGPDEPSVRWGYFRERFRFVAHVLRWAGTPEDGNYQQTWNPVQLGDFAKHWMTEYPEAFRFDDSSDRAFRGSLPEWGEHFTRSLQRLVDWMHHEA